MCFMTTEAPEIDLDASLRKGLSVRAGCPIRLFAVIRGRPAPKVTWKRMGVDNVVRRGHVDQVDSMSFLVIPESTREDSGRYSLSLSNSSGEKAVYVRVKVLGKNQRFIDSRAVVKCNYKHLYSSVNLLGSFI